MKVLLDSCIAGSVAPALSAAGHDVECVADWPQDPGDTVILSRAYQARQVVITLDKDFGELVVVRGQEHAGIVRLVDFNTAQQADAAVAVLKQYALEIEHGALVTAEAGRTRVRPANRP